ncbi:MAG: presenilin family intramembrane aspartyl protease [Nanoarchaeota archaeon]
MFLITQFIGVYVVNYYSSVKVIQGNVEEVASPDLPFGLETPKLEATGEFNWALTSIIFSFMIAVFLLLFLTKLNAEFFIKLWFFFVIVIALGIFFNTIIPDVKYKVLYLLAISLPLSFIKIYKRDFFVHNTTELFVYPGIASVFVPLLNIYTIIVLLIIISIYDIWAVWHSGIMQKMAKYQINKLNIFSGFFIPYASKKVKEKLKTMKSNAKSFRLKKGIKVNVAILGGGDVVFPIITAGVMLKTLGLFSALLVVVGATIGLGYLFFFAEKKKFYPAMPFISAGIFAGILVSYLVIFLFR